MAKKPGDEADDGVEERARGEVRDVGDGGDEWIARLAKLFVAHPAWVEAAGRLDEAATSGVYFRHRPGEAWRLETRGGVAVLLRGAAKDPDLVFRFSPGAIERLEAVEGSVGDFAVVLFEGILDREVDLRIRADFGRLVRRGYLKLLLSAGGQVIAFGAKHGIRTVGALARFVGELRSGGKADWEEEIGQRSDTTE